ncbi:hypothetical protein D3C87_1637920 [compost metagenome]
MATWAGGACVYSANSTAAKKNGSASKALICAALARARQPSWRASHARGSLLSNLLPPALAMIVDTNGSNAAANINHAIIFILAPEAPPKAGPDGVTGVWPPLRHGRLKASK